MIMGALRRSKIPAPRSRKAPNPNCRTTRNGFWGLDVAACLEFGIWSLELLWILDLGAWRSAYPFLSSRYLPASQELPLLHAQILGDQFCAEALVLQKRKTHAEPLEDFFEFAQFLPEQVAAKMLVELVHRDDIRVGE